MNAITTDAVVTYLYTYLNRIKNVIAKHTKGQRVNTRETEKKNAEHSNHGPYSVFFILKTKNAKKKTFLQPLAKATECFAVCMSDSGNFCLALRCSRFMVCMQSINQLLKCTLKIHFQLMLMRLHF